MAGQSQSQAWAYSGCLFIHASNDMGTRIRHLPVGTLTKATSLFALHTSQGLSVMMSLTDKEHAGSHTRAHWIKSQKLFPTTTVAVIICYACLPNKHCLLTCIFITFLLHCPSLKCAHSLIQSNRNWGHFLLVVCWKAQEDISPILSTTQHVHILFCCQAFP